MESRDRDNQEDLVTVMFKETVESNAYHIYLHGEITSKIEKYVHVCQTLKLASPNDMVYMYINSPGGDFYMATQIMAAMDQSQATIITSIEGQAASCASMIFLKGDRFIITDHATMLIHYYSGTFQGKGNEVITHVVHAQSNMKNSMANLYGGFLTDDEISGVVEGRDIWFGAEEIRARLPSDKLMVAPVKYKNMPVEE